MEHGCLASANIRIYLGRVVWTASQKELPDEPSASEGAQETATLGAE